MEEWRYLFEKGIIPLTNIELVRSSELAGIPVFVEFEEAMSQGVAAFEFTTGDDMVDLRYTYAVNQEGLGQEKIQQIFVPSILFWVFYVDYGQLAFGPVGISGIFSLTSFFPYFS